MEANHTDDKQFLLWNAGQYLGDSMRQHDRNMARMMPMIANLQEILESTRVAYNTMIADRDAKRQLLVAAEGRLAEVQRVVQRYIIVQQPVVASDGYTYERNVIQQYLEECEENNASAYSQQTKEVLKDTLIPNQSLKKLVDLLKTVKPQEVPPVTPRSVIPSFRAGNSVNWGEEEEDDDKPIHASELEAGLSQKKEDKKPDAPPRAESAKEALLRNNGSANSHAANPRASGGQSSNSGNAGSSGNNASGNNKLHPCLRVYGFCNFKDDCTFARYPYDACLNNIKGKCRFGSNCKELHVNPNDSKFLNPKNPAGGSSNGQSGNRK